MDETEERKDTSERDSSGEQKGTSEKEPETFTKESQEKAVSDALSAAGRDAKSITDKATEAERILTDAKKMQTDAKTEREQWQRDRDETELESHRDDPEALKSLQERQRQRNEATKLASEKTELAAEKATHDTKVADDLEQIRVFKRTQLAAEVAVDKGVKVNALLKLTKEDTREAMEATAELLPKSKETTALKTDSGTTTGGEKSQEQRLKDRYPSMK